MYWWSLNSWSHYIYETMKGTTIDVVKLEWSLRWKKIMMSHIQYAPLFHIANELARLICSSDFKFQTGKVIDVNLLGCVNHNKITMLGFVYTNAIFYYRKRSAQLANSSRYGITEWWIRIRALLTIYGGASSWPMGDERSYLYKLSHWGRDKMAAIFQTKF